MWEKYCSFLIFYMNMELWKKVAVWIRSPLGNLNVISDNRFSRSYNDIYCKVIQWYILQDYISMVTATMSRAYEVMGQYSAVLLWRGQFSPKSSQNTSHSSPVRARYGVYLVGSNCDSFSASVTAVMYAISCYIEPRYNGTRPYSIFRVFRVSSIIM